MEQMKDGASGLFGWLKENQNEIAQGYQFIQSVIKNKGELPFAVSAAEESVPLPPINEE
jgi:hypothetical protein